MHRTQSLANLFSPFTCEPVSSLRCHCAPCNLHRRNTLRSNWQWSKEILWLIVLKCDDISIGTVTIAGRCGSLLEVLVFSYAQARWQGFLSGSDDRSVKPYVHWCHITVCVWVCSNLNWTFFLFRCLLDSFITQSWAVIWCPRACQVAQEWLAPYTETIILIASCS
jgi:hypothetical protein